MVEELGAPNTFMDPDPNAKKPRLGFVKTLANYEELAEGLEIIEKQLSVVETRVLGRREPIDMPMPKRASDSDKPEPGYIEKFDDLAIRIRSSVNILSNIANRLSDAI